MPILWDYNQIEDFNYIAKQNYFWIFTFVYFTMPFSKVANDSQTSIFEKSLFQVENLDAFWLNIKY